MLVLGAQSGFLCGAVCRAVAPLRECSARGVCGRRHNKFITGVVRAPITGIVLATEMTGSVSMLLPNVVRMLDGHAGGGPAERPADLQFAPGARIARRTNLPPLKKKVRPNSRGLPRSRSTPGSSLRGARATRQSKLILAAVAVDCFAAPAMTGSVLTRSNMPYSNAKMRLQSFFMLTTIQPSFFASS